MPSPKTVDEFIDRKPECKQELLVLRKLCLDSGYEETIKWGTPVYTLNGKNVVGLGAFKSYVGLWFFQGVFLSDTAGLLVNAQEGKTQAMRQMRFNHGSDIDPEIITRYLLEARENQKLGKEIKPKRTTKEWTLSDELKTALEAQPKLKKQFLSLSNAVQKEYNEYIKEAKKIETKQRRIKKIIPMIEEGMGLNDTYKKGRLNT